jgi:hypothetical protein
MVHADFLADYPRVAPQIVPTSPELNVPIPRYPDIQLSSTFTSKVEQVTDLSGYQHIKFYGYSLPRVYLNRSKLTAMLSRGLSCPRNPR